MNTLLIAVLLLFIVCVIFSDQQLPEIIDINNKPNRNSNDIYAVKITKFGFNTENSNKLLNSILNNPKVVLEKHYKLCQLFNKKYVTISDYNPSDSVPSDVAFLFIDKTFLVNSKLSVERIFKAFSSIITDDKKPSIVFIISSKSSDTKRYAELLSEYISQAWTLIKEKYPTKVDINSAIDIQVISVGLNSVEVSSKASDMISEVLENLSNSTRPESFLYNFTTSTKPIEVNKLLGENTTLSINGVDNIDHVINQVKNNITKAYESTLTEIKKPKSIETFSKFINDMIDLSHADLVKISKNNNITNENIILSAQQELNKYIFNLYNPIYLKHIETIKAEEVQKFNDEFVDLDITIHLEEDYKRLQRKTLNSYSKRLNQLKPKNAPISWDYNFDIFALNNNFNDFIEESCNKYRLKGVLKRNIRKPVDISFHCFLTHPLGRDYRQDPIGLHDWLDSPIYDKSLANMKDISIHPSKGNVIIKNSLIKNKLKKNDKEFMREMLMFPLSIKNPDVPLMGSRSKKRSYVPKLDHERRVIGPERFIRWDIEPMDEIKENIDEVIRENRGSHKTPIIDQVFNIFPMSRRAYYIEPPIKYGSKYGPSKVKN